MRGVSAIRPGLVIGHEPVGVIEERARCETDATLAIACWSVPLLLRPMPRLSLRAPLASADMATAMRPWADGALATPSTARKRNIFVPSAQANLAKIPHQLTDVSSCSPTSLPHLGAEAAPVRIGDAVVVFAQGGANWLVRHCWSQADGCVHDHRSGWRRTSVGDGASHGCGCGPRLPRRDVVAEASNA